MFIDLKYKIIFLYYKYWKKLLNFKVMYLWLRFQSVVDLCKIKGLY